MMLASSSTLSGTRQQKVKEVEGGDNNTFIPQEIILNILKRLPVKSLIRFKCVCKHWRNLIQTPSFIQDHLHYSTHQNPSLLFGNFVFFSQLKLFALNTDMKVAEFHYGNVPRLLSDADLIGSSNGLLCYYKNGDASLSHPILLWNPAIRDVKLVDGPPNNFYSPYFVFGFGFNAVVNDYKIVRLVCAPRVGCSQVMLYSSKAATWKEVESSHLNDVNVVDFNGFAFNGSIFWSCHKLEGEILMLVSFDLALELFTLMPSPVTRIGVGLSCLSIFENKLAFLSTFNVGEQEPYSSSIDLWVLEDETGKVGERSGWTKKFSFRHSLLICPTTIWTNKMVCIPSDSEYDEREVIVIFNLTTSEVTKFDTCEFGMIYDSLNHVDSLVPVSNDYNEEL